MRTIETIKSSWVQQSRRSRCVSQQDREESTESTEQGIRCRRERRKGSSSSLVHSQRSPELTAPTTQEPPTFPLVDVPDHTLTEEDLKEKRKQRLLKGAHDARIRAKVEKEAAKIREVENRRREEEARRADMSGWIRGVRREYDVRSLFRFSIIVEHGADALLAGR